MTTKHEYCSFADNQELVDNVPQDDCDREFIHSVLDILCRTVRQLEIAMQDREMSRQYQDPVDPPF